MKKIGIYLIFFFLIYSYAIKIQAQPIVDTISSKRVFLVKRYYYGDKNIYGIKFLSLINSQPASQFYYNKYKTYRNISFTSIIGSFIALKSVESYERNTRYNSQNVNNKLSRTIGYSVSFTCIVSAYYFMFKAKSNFKKSIKAYNKAVLTTY